MISIIVFLLIIGVVCWIIQSIPIAPAWIKNVIFGIIGLFALIWILNHLGLNPGININ